jgi:hypothetical protein
MEMGLSFVANIRIVAQKRCILMDEGHLENVKIIN